MKALLPFLLAMNAAAGAPPALRVAKSAWSASVAAPIFVVSPDGSKAAAGTSEPSIAIIEMKTGRLIGRLGVPGGAAAPGRPSVFAPPAAGGRGVVQSHPEGVCTRECVPSAGQADGRHRAQSEGRQWVGETGRAGIVVGDASERKSHARAPTFVFA